MHSKFKILLLCPVFCILCTVLTACSEPAQSAPGAGSPDMIRRAQLVGQENLQLKKQIVDLETQITGLEKQLADAQAEVQTVTEQHGEATRLLMMRLLECSTKLEALQQD